MGYFFTGSLYRQNYISVSLYTRRRSMKKTIAMLLVLVMVLSLGLSACGNKPAENTNQSSNSNEAAANTNEASANTNDVPEPEPPATVESLLKPFMEKVKSGIGASYSTDMAMKISIEALGQSQTVEMSSRFETEGKGDITHVTGTMEIMQDGENNTADMDAWTVRSGEKITSYTKTDGTWYKQDSNLAGYIDGFQSLAMNLDLSGLTLSEADNEYIIQGSVDIGPLMDKLKDLLSSMEEIGDFDALDLSKVAPADVIYRFDKTTKDLTYCEMDLKESYQDIMDQFITILIDQLTKQDENSEDGEKDPLAGLDLSSLIKMETEVFNAKTTDIKLDPELKLELPEEAKNAKDAPVVSDDDYADYHAQELCIYLPDDFEEQDAASYGYDGIFANDKAGCAILREDKASLGDAVKDLSAYATLLRSANAERSPGELKDVNGHPVFEYTYKTDDGTGFSYFTAVFESEKAFWMLQFFSDMEDYEQLRPSFVDWIDTVSFTE